jgi:hypothetical protein
MKQPHSTVVVYDLHILGSALGPPKADAILVVNPDAVLPSSVTPQLLQSIGRRCSEIFERMGLIQLVQLAPSDFPEACRARAPRRFGVGGVEDVPGARGREASDHGEI